MSTEKTTQNGGEPVLPDSKLTADGISQPGSSSTAESDMLKEIVLSEDNDPASGSVPDVKTDFGVSDNEAPAVRTDMPDLTAASDLPKKQSPKTEPSSPECLETKSDIIRKSEKNGHTERATIRTIKGHKSLFTFFYVLICFILSVAAILSVIALIALAAFMLSGKLSSDDILYYAKRFAVLDFGSFPAVGAADTEIAAAAAGGAAVFAASGILAVFVLGVMLKIYIAFTTKVTQVIALLPGSKRGYIPCEEGVYKLIYHNYFTGSRFYSLYLWNSLRLHYADTKKERIFLKHRRIQLCLEGRTANISYFHDLRDIVLTSLPESGRVAPAKRDGFKWIFAAALFVLVIAAVRAGAWGYDRLAAEKDGGEYCDIGGTIHVQAESNMPLWQGREIYSYVVYDNSKAVYQFCVLHSGIYLTLHPFVYATSLPAMIAQMTTGEIFPDPMIVLFNYFLPFYLWLMAILVIIAAGYPKILRFRQL